MKIRLYATFRELVGHSELTWTRPTPTLGVLLEDMCREYGETFRHWVNPESQIGHWTIFLINGRDSRHLQGLSTPLQPDDTVVLFPPVAGG